MVVVMSPQLKLIVMVINLILDKTKVISFSCLQLQTFHMCSSVIISVKHHYKTLMYSQTWFSVVCYK